MIHPNSTIILRFRESKIQLVMLPLKGHEANPTELFQAVMQEDVKRWRAPGRPTREYGPMNFREAQKAVSDVLGRLRFNTAAFRG